MSFRVDLKSIELKKLDYRNQEKKAAATKKDL